MASKRNAPPLFECDECKSRLNKLKHGIDFIEAQSRWQDEALLEGRGGALSSVPDGRPDRRQAWSAAVTYRGSTVPLISVRRARAKEIEAYEGQ